jgi:hypothetical protein
MRGLLSYSGLAVKNLKAAMLLSYRRFGKEPQLWSLQRAPLCAGMELNHNKTDLGRTP